MSVTLDTLVFDIPLGEKETNTAVRIHANQLPEEPEEIGEILRAEGPPLSLWIDIAKTYLAQGKDAHFKYLLQEGCSDDADSFYGSDYLFERMLMRVTLAALAIAEARDNSDELQRSKRLAEAAAHISKAKGMIPTDGLPYLISGQLALIKRDFAAAKQELRRGMHMPVNGTPNNSCRLALAAVLFNDGEYAGALQLYCEALQCQPRCPAQVRLGIAHCQFRLGKLQAARAAYQRALDLDPSSVEATLGLALLDINSGAPQGVHQGLGLLAQAFQQQPRNPVTMVLMAQYCVLKQRYHEALKLAEEAFNSNDLASLRAMAASIIGRAHHALGARVDALKWYNTAHKYDGKLPLPRLGMCQMLLVRTEYTNAASSLLKLLDQLPCWQDALELLWAASSKLPAKSLEESLQHFRDACEKDVTNAHLKEMLGDLLTHSSPTEALRCYDDAIRLYNAPPSDGHMNGATQANGIHVDGLRTGGVLDKAPARLLNNCAVLTLRMGNVARAQQLMDAAVAVETRAMPDEQTDSQAALRQMTLGYNRARLLEAAGQLQAAEDEYLKAEDAYPDSLLRLAVLSLQRGDQDAAFAWVDRAMKHSELQGQATALKASIHLSCKQYDAARELLKPPDEAVAAPGSRKPPGGAPKQDAYAKICLANMQMALIPSERSKLPEDQRKRAQERFRSAFEKLYDVLNREPANAFAAHGLGCLLAELGFVDAAKDIFVSVQEASAAAQGFVQVPDVIINLGHLYLAQEQTANAARMYDQALHKCPRDRHPDILQCLARAFYEGRKKDINQLLIAKQVLLRALHMQPNNFDLMFNAALCSQEFSVKATNKERTKDDPTKLAEIKMAVRELAAALKTFKHLRSLGVKVTGLEDGKLEMHIKFVEKEAQAKAKKKLEDAEAEARVVATRRTQQLQAMEAQRLQREQKLLEQQLQEKARLEQLQRQAQLAAAKAEGLKARWRAEQALTVSVEGDGKSKGKKRKSNKADVDFVDDSAIIEEAERKAAEKAAKKGSKASKEEQQRILADTGLESSDNDGADALLDDDNAEDGRREGQARPTPERAAPAGGRLKRRKTNEGDEDGTVAMDDVLDDEDDVAVDGGEGGPSGGGDRKRRTALVDDESDHEPDGQAQQQPDTLQQHGSEAPATVKPAQEDVDDLFGDDEDD